MVLPHWVSMHVCVSVSVHVYVCVFIYVLQGTLV